MTNSTQNKKVALQFLKLVVKGKIDEAYKKYVDFKGKHHNLFFPAGFVALKDAMKQAHVQFPNKKFTTKNVLADKDLVAVHSKMVLKPGEPGIAVVHLFRLKKEKIVEMWDCGQAIPENCPNTDGAF